MTEVETLRAAAEKLRAGVAHCAPEAHNYQVPDGHGIAVLRPEFAMVLAAWLDESADDLERSLPHWTGSTGGIPGEYPPIHRTPEDTAQIVEHHFGRALAVARVLLGEVRS